MNNGQSSGRWTRALTVSSGLLCSVLMLPAQGQAQVSGRADCDRACLEEIAGDYMEALVAQDHNALDWAETVYFTEDQVSMMVGDALWGAISGAAQNAEIYADPKTGNVAWFGWVEEHGAPAYYGMRLGVREGRIAEVETIVARKEEPGYFHEDVAARATRPELDGELAGQARSRRGKMRDIAHGFYSTVQQNDGTLYSSFAEGCQWYENGVDVIAAVDDGALADCRELLELGFFAPVDRVRERRFPLIDEERGVVVAFSTRDRKNDETTWTTNDGKTRQIDEVIYYPHSRGTIDVIRIEDEEIVGIRSFSNFLPYYMSSPWQERKLSQTDE